MPMTEARYYKEKLYQKNRVHTQQDQGGNPHSQVLGQYASYMMNTRPIKKTKK